MPKGPTRHSFPVFFIEPTERSRYWLRRYARHDDVPCPNGYHCARTKLGTMPSGHEGDDPPPPSDPRWPTKCEHCEYEFAPEDRYQLFSERIYRRHDDHRVEMLLSNAPPGAIWNATWAIEDRNLDDPDDRMWLGPDNRSLVCRLPDGTDWMIDSQAANCTMPKDHKHKCWVRTGRPEDGTINVSKGKPGESCKAGAGSIQSTNWHGFLRNGHLVK